MTIDPRELAAVVADLRCHLAWNEADGVRRILMDREKVEKARAAAQLLASSRPAPGPTARPAPVASSAPPVAVAPSRAVGVARPAGADSAASPEPSPTGVVVVGGDRVVRTLDEVRRELGNCSRCKLAKGRKNLVFGVGNPRAELLFAGEGPGAEEDLQGIPFVGAAGQLLTKMIEAMGFSRDQVYICNVVKCRPPGNRNPEPDEIEACEPFLKQQIDAVRPKAIVALGKFAAQTLLRDTTPITRLRGRWREYQGIRLMPTFHPAYLLRQPGEKRLAWDDLKQVMVVLGREPRQKP